MKCVLDGFGSYLPDQLVTNQDLEKLVETTDEWITTRTGIHSRYYAAEDQAVSDLALGASQAALRDAGLEAKDLTHILVATCTPDMPLPSSACFLQYALGANPVPAFDVHAVCAGFLFALESARAIVCLHPDARVLVVGSEKMTSRLNFEDRSTCVLFGDGAGAVIVRGERDRRGRCEVVDILLRSDGSMADLLKVEAGGSRSPLRLGQIVTLDSFIAMQGGEVFKSAVRSMAEVSQALLERNGLSVDDIDLFIPHQANMRIINSIAHKLKMSDDKIFVTVQKYGNISAACIPVALSEAWEKQVIRPGDKVLLSSFGAGFAWGSVLLQF